MENSISLFSVKAHDNAVTKGYLCKQSGQFIFTSSPRDVIKLWSIHNTSPINYYNNEKANVLEMKTDINETRFGYLTENSKMHVYDMQSSKVLRTLCNEQSMYTTFEFLDANRMVCCLSNSRIQIIDLKSKSIITEFIGHNAPVTRIGQFHGSSEFYTIDNTGVVNIWNHRNLCHRATISFPPNSIPLPINNDLFAYYSNSTIYYTTSHTETPINTIPISFQPYSLYAVLDKDLFLPSSSSLFHFSYQSNRIDNLGKFTGILDIGKERAMLLPVLTTSNSTITLTGISLHQHPSFTTSHVLSHQELEEVHTIKQQFLPADVSRLSKVNSVLESDSSSIMDSESSFLATGTVVKASVQDLQSSFCSSDDSSMIVSEDSPISASAPRKVIKPRLSTNVMRSSLQRVSESHVPSNFQPRKSIALTSALVKPAIKQSQQNTVDSLSSVTTVHSTLSSNTDLPSPSPTPRQSLSGVPIRSSLPPIPQASRQSLTPSKPTIRSPTIPVKPALGSPSYMNRSINTQGGRVTTQSMPISPVKTTQSVTSPLSTAKVASPSASSRLTPQPNKRPSTVLLSPIPSKVQQQSLRTNHSQPSSPTETPNEEENNGIANVLMVRRQTLQSIHTLLQEPVEKQKLMEYLKGVNDMTVLSLCLKECEKQLIPTTVNEMTEILPILSQCVQVPKERILLSVLQFLRLSLQELPKFQLTGDEMDLKNQLGVIELALMNLDSTSYHSPLLPLYITECLNLLDGY